MSTSRVPSLRLRPWSGLVLLVVVSGCFAPGPLDSPALRYEQVDMCGRPVTTSSQDAQEWFDQGLTLLWGFNHDEATRSFYAATQADPECSMAWWGLAMASGVDINDPSLPRVDAQRAYLAAQQAVATSSGATAVEIALATAVAARFADPMPSDRSDLDEAYAAAMKVIHEDHPGDPDVAALFAESLMIMQPWDYWDEELQPKGRTLEAIEALETALAVDPDHAGAAHFLIHATEVAQPERAEAAADRLAHRVPGAGHLLHMPSHIYVHVGRYADAADCNERAIAADDVYMQAAPAVGNYWGYHAHNVHMLAYAAMMEGREEVALGAANRLADNTPEEVILNDLAWMDGLMATKLHVLIRFGYWDEILAQPDVAEERLLSRAQRHYARGVALSALGRTDEARLEQQAFQQIAPTVPESWIVGANPSKKVLELAGHMLAGELLWREGRIDEAFEEMAAGVAAEDAMNYDEPPGWMQPVRHAYGALLMAADRAAEAEAVYRKDLEKNPGNGWALLGLREACRAQGKDTEADAADEQLADVWARADVSPTSSCFCEPGAG